MATPAGSTERRARRVYLVRHGQTELSVGKSYSGRQEIPLDDHGREQALEVGERLRDVGVDAIYSSPLSRAADTAQAISEATGVPVVIDHRLTEVDYGQLEGYDRDSASEEFGEPFDAWREDPFGSPVPGTEPLAEALARVRAATGEALAAGECPVIVGHQGVLRLVLIALGKVERGDYFDTRLEEAEPVEIEAPRLTTPGGAEHAAEEPAPDPSP